MLKPLVFLLLACHPVGAGPRLPQDHADAPAGEWTGYTSLFDGKTLDGWTTTGGRYDGAAVWTVEHGAIVGRRGPKGEGGLIYPETPYRNFEFACDVRVDYPFDSGIFVRMTPEVKGAQITIDHRPGGEIGGIYSEGWLEHNPEGEKLFRKGEWNRFWVRCTGDMHLTSYVNGRHLVSYRLPEGAEGYARTGLIGLQVHGAADAAPDHSVAIRNVWVRDLGDGVAVPDTAGVFERDPAGYATLTRAGVSQGWSALFDGRSLDGWEVVGNAEGYRVEDGVMAFYQGGGGYIRTLRDFRDFRLRLDFKTGEMANSGLFLRGNREGGDPAYSGCEIQILDDFNWESVTNSKLRDYQFTGGLYGAVPNPRRDALRPLGEWNTYDVLFEGSRIRVTLNDVELYDVDTLTLDKAKPPFDERVKEGFIGLQRHAPAQAGDGAYAWFRNLFIQEL